MKTSSRGSLLAAAMVVLLAGCSSYDMTGPSRPSLSLSATRSDIKVNESATVVIKSANTLGTRPKVTWATTMGRITPVEEGMLDFRADKPTAIFTSDKPGQAVVTATLTTDDGRTLSDSVKFYVEPKP